MSSKVQVKATISGRVQGVFYRMHTQKTADRIGVKGYVMNLADGSVEAVFQGKKELVDQAIQWCRQGPDHARVDRVDLEPSQTLTPFESFEIRY